MNRPLTESFKLLSFGKIITNCLLPIDNRDRFALLCSFKDSMTRRIVVRCYVHATYSSLVFSWIALSRSMLSFVLTNDVSKSSHFISFTWSRDIDITLQRWRCHRSNILWHVIPCRMFAKNLVTSHVHYLATSRLYQITCYCKLRWCHREYAVICDLSRHILEKSLMMLNLIKSSTFAKL